MSFGTGLFVSCNVDCDLGLKPDPSQECGFTPTTTEKITVAGVEVLNAR